jgi:hypothetical protein
MQQGAALSGQKRLAEVAFRLYWFTGCVKGIAHSSPGLPMVASFKDVRPFTLPDEPLMEWQ